MREFPFSRDEFYSVMQFFLDEKQAAEVVDSLFGSTASPGEISGIPRPAPEHATALPDTPDKVGRDPELRFECVSGITFTEDTLILLSLLSSETETKINAYRHAPNRGGVTAEEEQRWQERRALLASLPEVRRWRAKFGAP